MSLYLFTFFMETLSYILVFRFVLHSPITHSLIRRCASVTVILLWSVLIITEHEPCPYIVGILVCLLLLYSEKWYFMICWYTVYSLILLISSSYITYFIYITGNRGIDLRLISRYASLAVLVLIVALCCMIRNKVIAFSEFLHTISVKESLLVAMVCFMNYILSGCSSILFIQDTINTLGRQLILFAILSIVFMSMIILYFYFRLKRYHFLLQQNDNMNRMLLQQEKQYYMDLQKKNMDIRAFRHDFNQHILALHELASAKEDTAVYQYIDRLMEFQERANTISTNHIVADAIVNYFYSKKRETTIFHVEGKLKQDLFISDNDLCTILSNLLKNATEAVECLPPENIPSENEPKIMLTLFSNKEYLSIKVINSSKEYDEKELTELKTTKRNTKDHGFGIPNILATLQKYKGIIDFSYADGYFTANVYIRNLTSERTDKNENSDL